MKTKQTCQGVDMFTLAELFVGIAIIGLQAALLMLVLDQASHLGSNLLEF